jgi:hypothetical protein
MVLVTLGVGLSLAFAGATAAKVVPLNAATFQSTGDLINGWTWVRSTGKTATYTFDASALQGAKLGSVYLNLTALVTNGVNGGSGYSTAVKFAVTNGTKTGVIVVPLTNPFRPIDRDNSGGVGYQAYGHAYVSSSYYKGAQTLTFTYTFPTSSHAYHVAFNQSGMTMAFSTGI